MMKLEEYLNTVMEQIRCRKARELVSDELKNHILDQAEAYEADGMFEEEALEKAVREMGDPVETGVALDRVHRPEISVEILILIGIISILSIAVHAAFAVYSQDMDGAGFGYLKSHIMYTICGYAAMLVVYRLDYSILARYGKQIAGIFLLFVLLGGRFVIVTINGAACYIRLGPVLLFLPMVMYLFAPLFGGVLYQYRGEGCLAFGKIFLWAAVPLYIAFHIPSLNLTMVLWATFAVLFSIAVWQGWYRVNKKRVLAVLWSCMLVVPALFVGFMYVTGGLASYQAARLQAFFAGKEVDYQAGLAARCLIDSTLLGGKEANIAELGNFPGFNNDYVFVSLVTTYGILAGVLVTALLVFLIVKIFRVSLRQRNQLGMILGCACGTVFLCQFLLSMGVNLGLLPSTSTNLPFFSSGGSGTLVCYILLGLVLSVYRYRNILKEKPGKKAVTTA